MKLIYSGNDYKYDTEAIMKLFLPAQSFEFVYDTYAEPAGDYAFMRKRVLRGAILLYVIAQYGGRKDKAVCRLPLEAEEECSERISRLLYEVMSRLTGIKSDWGILTGVRPVKQVHRLIAKGMSREQIFETLGSQYLVSEKKTRLAYDTAKVQQPILAEIEKGGRKNYAMYISVPFCPTRCSYCSFVSQAASRTEVKKLIPVYVDALCEEIRFTAEVMARLGMAPDSVYIGGGTPTTLSAEQLARIMKTAAESFDLSGVKEYTVEAGRPDTITEDKLAAIKENGCTRISVNPQTLNDEVLRIIGRAHTTEQFMESFKLARKLGFGSINTDIIAGLPSETPESFRATLEGLTALSPESITVHTLSIKRAAKLNSAEEKQEIMKSPAGEMVDLAAEMLSGCGYRPYYLYRQKNMIENLENVGWVKPGHESLYNIAIMEEVEPIIALGAAGSTKLIDSSGHMERIFNYKHPVDYNANIRLMLERKKEIEKFYGKEK